MVVRLVCVALSMFVAACATVSPHADWNCTPATAWDAPTPEPEPATVARAEAAPDCDGVEIELLVRDDESVPEGGWSRRIALRCHARGATLTYETGCAECEIGTETIELARADATALWSELRGVSLASLECARATGALGHRIQIASARGVRVVECNAPETPAAWSALEAILSTARETEDAELWPYDAEYWRDELRYAGSAP